MPVLGEDNEPVEDKKEKVKKTRSKTTFVNHSVNVSSAPLFSIYTEEQIKLIQEREKAISERDEQTMKIKNIRNEILNECFRLKEELELDSKYAEFILPEDRTKLNNIINEAEEIAEYSDDATFEVLQEILSQLNAAWQPVQEAHNATIEKSKQDRDDTSSAESIQSNSTYESAI